MSVQGQPIEELVNGTTTGNIPGSPISVGRVSMAGGHIAKPHEHRNTWVYVLVVRSGDRGAITAWGPTLDGQLHQAPGQLLVIPPNVRHAAISPDTEGIIAYEFRSNPCIHDDNHLIDDLQPALDVQRPYLLDLLPTTETQ